MRPEKPAMIRVFTYADGEKVINEKMTKKELLYIIDYLSDEIAVLRERKWWRWR